VGSRNGTFRVEPWARLAELVLEDDARVVVGDTVLRFRARTHAVEPTRLTAMPVAPRARLFERPFAFPATLAATVVAFLLYEYLTSFQKTDWGALAVAVFAPVFIAFAWTALWSVSSRVARRRFYFGAHGTIASVAMMGLLLVPLGLTLVTYGLSLGPWVKWLYVAGYLGWMGTVFFWHLRYVTRWESRRLVGVLAAILVICGTLMQADTLLGEEEFSPWLPIGRTLLPPDFQVVPAKSVESFFEETRGLQDEVDALVKE
jgi:hypothetical protein